MPNIIPTVDAKIFIAGGQSWDVVEVGYEVADNLPYSEGVLVNPRAPAYNNRIIYCSIAGIAQLVLANGLENLTCNLAANG